MGILQKLRNIPASKNLIREWPNENGFKNIFNLCDTPVRLLHIFFDELLDRYNVEMFNKNCIYDPIETEIC